MNKINSIIRMGGNKGLVQALMQRESRCVVSPIKGADVRFILRNGVAITLFGKVADKAILEELKGIVGNGRTEVRLSA